MIESLRAAFAPYDAIVSPTLPTVAYPVGVPFDKAYPAYPGETDLIAPGNLAGLPALAVPNGIADHDLPSGIAFLGHAFGEGALASIARRYQELAPHTRRPVLVKSQPAS
jgi:aspartyl-tRNA(Asn)/glutamyl-tRNA(Gln) amidotransferase subunit A